MVEVTMPKMSDTMEEGKVIKWLKREGDQVNEGEPIAEIETDKANVEMESFEPGIIKQLLVKEGDTVPVGKSIALIEAPETAGPPRAAPEEAPKAEAPEIPQVKAPEAHATEQVPLITTPTPPEAQVSPPKVEEKPAEAAPEERIKASPLARRMAEENNIDLSKIHGTGPDGRIVESDIENYMKQTQAPPTPPPAAPAHVSAPPTTIPREEGEIEERPISKIRKVIAERMTRSKQTIPHFYVTSEFEMDWASKVRDELNMDGNQVKISFTDILIKACALAIRSVPQVNASFAEDKLILHKEINIGMAVALEEGLIVPVIHKADVKSLREIASTTKELAKRAKENNLHSSDLTGATFTISNLGMFDVESFASIINPPECASLAVGTIKDIPVVINESFGVSKRMKATISADHRILDGAVAARFMQELKRKIEAPISLL